MESRDYQPSEPLKAYVKGYRFRHFLLQQPMKQSFKPFPPRPEQCLTFYPRGFESVENVYSGTFVRRPRSVISGQFTQRVNRFLSYPEFLMIEVDLHPGALHRLTGVPFKELTNKDVDAEAFFPAEMRRVNERLGSAANFTEMIGIIETFLLQLLQKEKQTFGAVDQVLQLITHQSYNCTVDALAQQSFLSPRQLERKFDDRIGISPKTFLRICRFNQSYWLYLAKPQLDWLTIAIACGYNDYQHLVKDYKDFANATPRSFFNEEVKSPGRVLGLTK